MNSAPPSASSLRRLRACCQRYLQLAAAIIVASPAVAGITSPALSDARPAPPAVAPASTPDDAVAFAPSSESIHSEPFRFRFAGDVMFGRYRLGQYERLIHDNGTPFLRIAELLQGDVSLVNLETPLVRELASARPDLRPLFFSASELGAQHLAAAGVTEVSVANNHAADMGILGLEETPALLARHGVGVLGRAKLPATANTAAPSSAEFSFAPELVRVESVTRKGMKLGFIAVTSVLNFQPTAGTPAVPYVPVGQLPKVLSPLLAEARATHDLLLVIVHWGTEYAPLPAGAQRRAAKVLIEAGADLIVGHHPHVLQPIERFDGGLVVYSLGNFAFDSVRDPARLGGVLGVDIEDNCSARLRFTPVELQRSGQDTLPVPASIKALRQAFWRLLPPKHWGVPDRQLLSVEEGALVSRVIPFGCRRPKGASSEISAKTATPGASLPNIGLHNNSKLQAAPP